MPLQREAPNPLYMQVKEALLEDLLSGRYRPHDRLPSERELSHRFNVSRMTVRQAMLNLVRDGAIYARVGKGTFVAAPKIDQQLRTLTSFSQDVRSRGGQPTSLVLEAREMAASTEVATALQVAAGVPVLVLSRLRMADSVPLAVETTNLPLALCPNLFQHDFGVESLYQVLRSDYDIHPAQAEQVIEAALASPREAELLELTSPAAVLRMQRLTRDSTGRPIEYVHSTYRSDRYKFRSLLTVATPSLIVENARNSR
ncbi:MAG: GntR family transcriptional regulator [Caldilineales bacterium]